MKAGSTSTKSAGITDNAPSKQPVIENTIKNPKK